MAKNTPQPYHSISELAPVMDHQTTATILQTNPTHLLHPICLKDSPLVWRVTWQGAVGKMVRVGFTVRAGCWGNYENHQPFTL